MAITKTIEIDVNSLKAVGGLENLDKALKQVDKSAKSVDATFEEVYGDLQPLTSRMGEAEDRLYELALAGQSATKEYQDLLQTVGNYRKVQMQTDMVVDAAATTFDAKLGGALQGVTSTFAGVQGAMALTGGESQKLEEALIKVNGAMALAEGVRGIREGMVAFKALGISARLALNGIKTGIAATGIGVLLIALGAIVAYWDDIKALVGGVSSEQEKLNAQAQANLDVQQSKLDAIGGQENILKLQGKSEKDILKLKIAQTDEVIKATENQIAQNDITAKAQIAASQRNRDILAGIIKFIQMPLTLLLEGVDMVGKALGQNFGLAQGFSDLVDKGASLLFDPEAEKKKAEETRKESLKAVAKLKNDKAGLQNSLNNIDAQAAKDAQAKQKEANDKAIELAKQKADALERIRQAEIDTEAERRAEELKKVQDEYTELIKEADKYNQSTLQLEEAQRTKENELKEKWRIEDEEKKLAADEKKKADDQKKLDDAKVLADKQIEIDKAVADGKLAIQEQSFAATENGLSLLKGLFEKNKAVQKGLMIAESAVGIARIVVATQAADAADTAAAALMGPAGVGYLATKKVLNKVSAGIGIAANIAATAKALGSLGGGSAGGGGANGTNSPSGTAPAPSFNVVGNSGVNQIAQTLGNQQPVQAYVVANNVTTQQSLDRNIVNNASLG
jgi:membrane protein involved in colicin uptake